MFGKLNLPMLDADFPAADQEEEAKSSALVSVEASYAATALQNAPKSARVFYS